MVLILGVAIFVMTMPSMQEKEAVYSDLWEPV